MNVLYYTTGRNNGKEVYYPPLVKSQVQSLSQFFDHYKIYIVKNSGFPLNLFKDFIKKSKSNDNDIVHSQYGSLTALVAWLNSGNKPLVISFCGSDLEGTSGSSILWKLRDFVTTHLSRWLSVRADKIIVKSENLRQILPGKVRKHAYVIPNGVDLKIFYPLDQAEAREKLNWNFKTKYILFAPSKANNRIVKNIPLAVKSVALLKSKVEYGVELVMLTNYTGEEVALMMNAGDCLLLTSFHEGSPNVVKEAMACNLPVVSVDVGDVRERLKNDYISTILNSYDPQEITEALSKIVMKNTRTIGFEEIKKQKLDSESIAKKIYQIYEELLNGKRTKYGTGHQMAVEEY